MPGRRNKVTDYIETKQVYHPQNGRLLGVFVADEIPADPRKLLAFVRRKAKAAKPTLEKFTLANSDDWDYLRKQNWWFQVLDPEFWKQLRAAIQLLPFGINADLTGLHDPPRTGSFDDSDPQLWRDHLKEQALLTVDRLWSFGLKPNSDPIDTLFEILKNNPKYGGTTTLVSSGFSGDQRQETPYVRCIRTALVAFYSALATQALENQIRRRQQQQAPAVDVQGGSAESVVPLLGTASSPPPGHLGNHPPAQDTREERRAVRQNLVMPILESKRWKRCRWAT